MLSDYFFKRALNGRKARLHLPAMKIRAVVGDVEAQPAHCCTSGRRARLDHRLTIPAKRAIVRL